MRIKEYLDKNYMELINKVYMYTLKNDSVICQKGDLFHRYPKRENNKWIPGDTVFIPNCLGFEDSVDISKLRCAGQPRIVVRDRVWLLEPDALLATELLLRGKKAKVVNIYDFEKYYASM